MPKAKREFYEALEVFLVGLNDMIERNHEAHFPSLKMPVLSLEEGSKLVRVVRDSGQKSVHCFIDKNNGDVLKAASWKAPAPHPRGNIYDPDNGMSAVGPYGAKYLKGKGKHKSSKSVGVAKAGPA